MASKEGFFKSDDADKTSSETEIGNLYDTLNKDEE